ncbi:MAG: D-alanyl-D-alanine carboxypeptidase, partial [Ruminococcus sp.]|nr:D-alanyl-D-alanine carboxypeptidase [Ruminococcus sp.]
MRFDRIRLFAGLTVMTMLLIFTIGSIRVSAQELPEISAKYGVVYNPATGEVIFDKNAEAKAPMASTTKIMSALIVLQREDLDVPFVVDSEAIKTEGSSMGLREGDQVTLRALVCGMLLPSGNDAANAAAVRVGGSVEGFVELMNRKASELGLENTHFVTPSGLDDYTDEHYSTALDMAKLAAEAMKNDEFRRICSKDKIKVCFGDPPYERWLTNTNKLLKMGSEYVGIKTGFTDKAKRCLVSACDREKGELICVTLNAPDDWNDHVKLYDYGYSKVSMTKIKPPADSFCVSVVGGESE